MANFSGSISSTVLDMKTGLSVVTPRDILNSTDPYKVVYLLHGLSDNCHDWNENTQLTLLANTYNVVFIMPEVQRSFYTDMVHGLKYFTYISDELPKLCKRLFNISSKREDTYVMGLSMGGYGALKCALSRPEQYAGCAAFSAACYLSDCLDKSDTPEFENVISEMKAVFGENYEKAPENETCYLAKICEKSPVKPDIFMTCGTEDFIYDMSFKFKNFMMDIDIPFTYMEWPGVHEWYLWNKSLHLACEHFFTRINPDWNYCNIK